MVMVGGVLSAVIVGFLLEKGDLYASIAAESYLQSAEDEEFWKGLSDEEQSKAREIMEKIKTSKSGVMMPEASSEPVLASSSSLSSPVEPKRKEPSKPADMFSDYGD